MSDESPKVPAPALPPLSARQIAYLSIALVLTVLLASAALCVDSYNKSKADPLPAPGTVAVVEPAVEQAPTAEYSPYAPRPGHVCPACPYRHYPPVAPVARPFNVTCPFCHNVLLATPPLGQLGSTGDTTEHPQ